MKKTILISNLICCTLIFSLLNIVYAAEWTIPERLDSRDGTLPTLSYSPQGDLRVFYNEFSDELVDIFDNPIREMVVRTRLNDETTFSPETYVWKFAVRAAVHYGDGEHIDLAVGQNDLILILKSTDNGLTWEWQKSIRSSEAVFGGYNNLALTEENSQLRLTYELTTFGFTSNRYFIYQSIGSGDTWSERKLIKHDQRLTNTYEFGDTIAVIGAFESYHSIDNGESYATINLAANDSYLNTNGRIFYVLTIQRSREQNFERDLVFAFSNDQGSHWSDRQTILTGSLQDIFGPRIIAEGKSIVIVWKSIEGEDEIQKIKGFMSTDHGQNWGPVETIVSLEKNQELSSFNFPVHPNDHSIDVAFYNGKISLAYSVTGGLNPGVYLTEMMLEPSIHTAPVLDFIGHKTIDENEFLEFTVTATDEDNDPLRYSTSNLPQGAVFDTETQEFSWTPTFAQAGEYNVSFFVSDNIDTDSEDITITVNDVEISPTEIFLRGDANLDRIVDVSDPIITLTHMFLKEFPDGFTCEDAADSDDNGKLEITDPINTLSILFLGTGNIPIPNNEVPGGDPTDDELGCELGLEDE